MEKGWALSFTHSGVAPSPSSPWHHIDPDRRVPLRGWRQHEPTSLLRVSRPSGDQLEVREALLNNICGVNKYDGRTEGVLTDDVHMGYK